MFKIFKATNNAITTGVKTFKATERASGSGAVVINENELEKAQAKAKFEALAGRVENGKINLDPVAQAHGWKNEKERKDFQAEKPNTYAVMGGYKYEPLIASKYHTPLTEEGKKLLEDAQKADAYYREYGVIDFAKNYSVNVDDLQNEITELEAKIKKAEASDKLSKNLVLDTENRMKKSEEVKDILAQYGLKNIDELKSLLAQKKQSKNFAEASRDLVNMTAVGDENSVNYDLEFQKWVDIGKNIHSQNLGGEKLAPHNAPNPVESVREMYSDYIGNPEELSKKIALNLADDSMVEIAAILQMTDKQVELYNYYLGKEYLHEIESGTADKYLNYLKTQYNVNTANIIQRELKNLPFFQYAYSAHAGLQSFFDNMESLEKSFFKNDTYTAETATQLANAKIREDVAERDGFKGQVFYDLINTTAHQLPSILTSTVANVFVPGSGAVIGAGLTGLSSTGGAYQEALRLGFDENEARFYSVGVGAAEAGLSYLLSGISQLGGKLSGQVISKAVDGIDNGIAKFALEYGGKMLSEGIEESLQEILDPIFKSLATNTSVEYWGGIDWGAVAYSGLLGALSAGSFENIPKAAINNIKENVNNKRIYGKDAETLVTMGLLAPESSQAYKLATKYNEKIKSNKSLTGTQLGMLVESLETVPQEIDKSKISAAAELRLMELGERNNTTEIAKAITKKLVGENVSASEEALIDNSKYGNRVLNEAMPENIASGEYSSAWAKSIGTNWINKNIYNINLQSSGSNIVDSGEILNYNESEIQEGESYGKEQLRNGDIRRQLTGENTKSGLGSVQETSGGIYSDNRESGIEPNTIYNQGNNRGIELTDEQVQRLKSTVIKNEDGTPKIVYHFTNNMDFEVFAKGDIGFHLGNESQARQRGKNLKQQGRIISAFLNIKNPIYINTDLMSWRPAHVAVKLYADGIITYDQYKDILGLHIESGYEYNSPAAVNLRKILADLGYDGIIYENHYEGDGQSYIAFYPEQVIIIDDGKFYKNQAISENGVAFSLSHNKNSSLINEGEFIEGLRGEDGSQEFSQEYVDELLDGFGITKLGDYIHVQKRVMETLEGEGFFTDKENRCTRIVNDTSGMVVEINKKGIKETFDEKNYANVGRIKKISKLVTIRHLGEIIKFGELQEDDVRNTHKGTAKNKSFAYIRHTVNIDGKAITVQIDIKKSPEKNKFWVHKIIKFDGANNIPNNVKAIELGQTIVSTKNANANTQSDNVEAIKSGYTKYSADKKSVSQESKNVNEDNMQVIYEAVYGDSLKFADNGNVSNPSKNDANSQLQSNEDNNIINSVGDIYVDEETNNENVRGIREKYFPKIGDNFQGGISESAEAFAERARRNSIERNGEERLLLNEGKLTIAYNPTKDNNSPKYIFINKLREYGIDIYYCDDIIETNVDGVTMVHNQAITTKGGKIFISSIATVEFKSMIDHELVHWKLRKFHDSYFEYEDIILRNLNRESNYFVAFCEELNLREYNNRYDIDTIEGATVFNSEITAYVYQYVLNDGDFAEKFFSKMFFDWHDVKNAVKQFNSRMEINTDSLNIAGSNNEAAVFLSKNNGLDKDIAVNNEVISGADMAQQGGASAEIGSVPNNPDRAAPDVVEGSDGRQYFDDGSGDEYNIPYSSEGDIISSFGIKKMNDTIHVQECVFDKLLEEGFFENPNERNIIVTNKDSGMVIEINKSGIRETFNFHNFTQMPHKVMVDKLAVIRHLPEIIENGRLYDDNVKNIHNKKTSISYAYITQKVNINGAIRTATVAIRKSPQKNKFWVLQIDIKNNIESTPAGISKNSKTGLLTSNVKLNLSQNYQSVNTEKNNYDGSGDSRPKSNATNYKLNNISKKDYDKFQFKKPIKVSEKDWAKVDSARIKKYLQCAEEDIPDIDFFRIAEYNEINVAHRYYIRNYDKYNFEIISKIKIKEEHNDVKTTYTNVNADGLRRGIDIGSSGFVEYGQAISSDDKLVERSEESDEGRTVNNGDSNSGRKLGNIDTTKEAISQTQVASFVDSGSGDEYFVDDGADEKTSHLTTAEGGASPQGEAVISGGNSLDLDLLEPAVADITRAPTAEESIAAAISGEQLDTKQRRILDFAEQHFPDINVKFSGNMTKNGLWDSESRTLLLNTNQTVAGMYTEVFKHEFMHTLESKRLYQEFKQFLFNKDTTFGVWAKVQCKTHGIELTQNATAKDAINALCDYYYSSVKSNMSIAKKYRDAFTVDGAQREMVADFFGEIMFNGKKYRTQTARALADETFLTLFDENEIAEFQANSMAALAEIAEYKPNIFEQIVDWVKRIILKLRGTQIRADRLLADELERNIKTLEDYVKQVYNSRETKKAAENSGGVEFSASEDIALYRYIEDVLSGNLQPKSYYKLSEKISDRLANDIEKIVGFSVDGYSNEISPGSIQHIKKQHGENGKRDQSMKDPHDLAKISYVINEYEKIKEGKGTKEFKNSDGTYSKTIVLQKKINDEYYYVVEAVPDAKLRTLHIVSAYKNKKDTLSDVPVSNDPRRYVHDEHQSNVSISNIPYPDENVNTEKSNDNNHDNPQLAVTSQTQVASFVDSGSGDEYFGNPDDVDISHGGDTSLQKGTTVSNSFELTEPAQKDIARAPSNAEVIEQVISGKTLNNVQRHITDIASKMDSGVKIEFVKGLKQNGRYIRSQNLLRINADLSTAQMYVQIFKHEFMHHLETKQLYASFSKYCFNKSKAFEQYARASLKLIDNTDNKYYNSSVDNIIRDGVVNTLANYYYDQYKNDTSIGKAERDAFTRENAKQEMVADFFAEVLFQGETYRKRIAAALATQGMLPDGDVQSSESALLEMKQKEPNLFKRLVEWLKGLTQKLRDLKQSKHLVDDIEKTIAYLENDIARLEQKAARVYQSKDNKKVQNETQGNIKFKIMSFGDGKNFVNIEADQRRFEGLTPTEMQKEAKKVIKENFVGKVIGTKNRTFVNSKSAGEYSYPSKFIKDDNVVIAKMRASTELNNLIDVGTNYRNEPDGLYGHTHNKATGGFDYYDIIFKVDDRYYSGVVNIMVTDRGKLLKDITKIEDISNDIITQYGKNPQGEFAENIPINSIYDFFKKIKDNSLFSKKENTTYHKSKSSKKITENSSGVKYSIINLDTGKSYVQASRQVISGNSVAEWRSQISDFFNKSLKNGHIEITTIEGDTLTISKDTANKARDKHISENGVTRELTDKEFLVKLNAEAHIDELAEISTSKKDKKGNKKIVPDNKNHDIAKDGFTYRTVYFQDFDDAYYRVTLSVGENNGISTVYNVGKIKADDIPNGNIVSAIGSKADMSSTKYSISNSTKNVNTEKDNDNSNDYATGQSSIGSPMQQMRYNPEKTVVEKYTESQYNNFGWVRYNDILSIAEYNTLLSRYADYRYNRNKYPTTRFDEVIIHSSECPDVLMYVKGDIDNHQITKIVRINIDEYSASVIKEKILNYEYRQIPLPYKYVEALYGEGIFDICRRQDYTSFREYRAEQERKVSRANSKFDRAESNGRRSVREDTANEKADSVSESAFSVQQNNRQDSIEKYSEEQYNNFGWVRYNEVLTLSEYKTLLSRYADYRYNRNKYPITRFGEVVIHSSECPSVLMYVKGDIDNPQITKVVRINEDEDFTSIIKEDLLHYEYAQVTLPWKNVESIYGEGILDISTNRDCTSFRSYSARTERRTGETDNNNYRAEQNGRGSVEKNTRVSRADSVSESAFSMQQDSEYAKSFNSVVEMAKDNNTEFTLLENRGTLSTSQVQDIYNATVKAEFEARENAKNEVTEKQGKTMYVEGVFDDSVIDYNSKTTDGSKVNWNSLTPTQREAIKFTKLFSKATGVNIKFIKSNVVKGKHEGKNGSYDPATNTIEIDVYAGRIDGKALNDTIIPTLSHELTHWMKDKSPAIYNSIREDVIKTLTENGKYSSDEMIAKEMQRMKKAHRDKEVTTEDAIDELVARACEDMLSNSNEARKLLAKMSATEQKGFIEKVKETIDNLIKWVNDLLAHYKSKSAEAETLREYKAMLKKISKQWDAMLVDAIKTNQAMQQEGITDKDLNKNAKEKNTTDEGDVKKSDRITENMTDSERYEILKNRQITLAEIKDAEVRKVISENPQLLDKKLKTTDAKKLLRKIGSEFGVFNKYENPDIEIEFEFGKNNLDESVNKQKGNYDVYAQMLSCFSDIITNAVGIEIHNRNKEGYKTDRTLKNVYVLCSAFENDVDIVPVKLEIKEFYDKPNRLYVAVALEGIKKDRVESTGVPTNRSHVRTSPVTISIHDLFSKINPKDTDFLKYIPNQFLDAEQIVAKNKTLGDVRYSDRDTLGNTLSEGQQSYFADSKVRDVFGKWEKCLDINKCKLFANATAKTEGHTRKPGFRLDGYSWEGVLSDFVIWDEFFELFPEYENLRVVVRSMPSDYDKVRFNPKAKTIYMDKELCREYINGESKILKSYIMRELQRIIQYEEGRYIGYSIEHWQELERKGKLPFSEKLNRYLTAEDMMKYFEDNYETELMFKKQEFKHYVSQDRKYKSINDMMMYYPVADPDEIIVYDDNGRLVTLKEKQNPKEKRRFLVDKSGQAEPMAHEKEAIRVIQEQSDRQIAQGNLNEITEKGDNTLKLREYVASKEKSHVKKQRIRNDYRIKGGNSGFAEKNGDVYEVLDEDYSFMLRSALASVPTAEYDTVGRYIGINNQQMLEDSVCKNEKGEPISLYFMNLQGDNLAEQIKRGLALGTVDMAVAQYNEHRVEHKRVQSAVCTEVYLILKTPICLPFDPQGLSYSEICDWLVNQDKITPAQHNRVVSLKSALKPYDYSNYATQALLDVLRQQGYDGIVYKNHRFAKGSKSVVPFYEHQLIPVAYDGILSQDNVVYDDTLNEGENLSITDAEENTENMKRYVIEPKYQNAKKRRLADERIKMGDAGCFEGDETTDAQSAYENINRELKNNCAKELSGYDTAGHRFTNIAIKNFDGNVFRDADGNILLFSVWNMNPLDIGKAADEGQEFVGLDTALEEFFEHKISTKNSYHGVIEQFALNCVKPLVVRQNGWNTEKMAAELLEDGIISQQFYDNLMSLRSTGSGDYVSLAATKLINEIIRKGCDCIVFVKDNGRHSVVPFFAEAIIPISQNGILNENSGVILLSEAEKDAAEKANGVVLDPKDRKERDFYELKNKIMPIKDKTEKMKRLTESLKYNNAPVWDEADDVKVGYSGAFERGTVNIWNAKNRFERMIAEQADTFISDLDTANRRLNSKIQGELVNSKLKDKNGRPLSFFIYAKQTQNGFERDTRGYRVSTLAAAHDEYLEISMVQPHRRKQIYNEYLVRAKNPYFMMSVPNELSAREIADSLYAGGVLDRYEYNSILTKSGIDEHNYKGIAAKHINLALQKRGIDSIVYMNGTYDRGSMGVMVLSDTQLIPVSQNGVQNENFVENAGENTFDFDDASGYNEDVNEGLSNLEKEKIKEKTGWSDAIVDYIRSMKEAQIYIDADLKEAKINGRKCLIRSDIDMEQVDKKGVTNRERIKQGMAPYAKNGDKIELHHIGQKNDSPLAELTKQEHRGKGNDTILHNKKKASEIERLKFNPEREIYWQIRFDEKGD